MDDQDELLEDPEVGVYLPDPNQDVIDEYAIPQDEDEQLGNLPFAGSAVGSAGWNLAGQGPQGRVPSHVSCFRCVKCITCYYKSSYKQLLWVCTKVAIPYQGNEVAADSTPNKSE